MSEDTLNSIPNRRQRNVSSSPAPRRSNSAAPIEAPTGGPTKPRAEVDADTRALVIILGVVWLRENVITKYGKAKLSEVTDDQLAEIHAAAVAEIAQREAEA